MLIVEKEASLRAWNAAGFFRLLSCIDEYELDDYKTYSDSLVGVRYHDRKVVQNDDICGVYILYFRSSGYFYIGSSINAAQRVAVHTWSLRKGNHHNPRMVEVYKRHNKSPEVIYLNTFGEPAARSVEQRLIDLVFNDPYCLNLRQLVEEYRPATEETKGRLRDAAKRQWEREGFRETIQEINRRPGEVKRRSDLGKRLGQDPERNKHFSETTKRHWERKEYREAQKKSGAAVWEDPEFRDRHSAAMRAHWADPEYRASIKRKPINYITITIGGVTYPHAKAAAAALGISVNTARRRAAKEVLDE